MPLDASVDHVLGRVDVLRLRVAAVVAARRAVDAAPDDPFLGLYLSDDKIDEILRNDRVWVAADVAADRRAAVEAAADAAAGAGAGLRLRQLADRFGLDDVDVDVLLAAMAPDIDDRFERYYGYLNDDVTRRRVSVGLALGLAALHAADSVGRRRFDAGSALLSGGLVEIEDPDRPFLTRAVRVPDRVTAHVLGADEPDAALGFVLRDVAPTAEPPFEPFVRALRQPAALVYVHDRIAAAAEPVVDAAAAVGIPVVVVDLDRLEPNADAERLVLAAVREARLRGGALVAGPIDQLADINLAAVQKLTAAPVPLVLLGHRGLGSVVRLAASGRDRGPRPVRSGAGEDLGLGARRPHW